MSVRWTKTFAKMGAVVLIKYLGLIVTVLVILGAGIACSMICVRISRVSMTASVLVGGYLVAMK